MMTEVKRNPCLGIMLFTQKPSLQDERKWFKETVELAAKGHGFALVAKVDGKVVGLADVRDRSVQREQRHIGVVGIYILEGYRSIGVGTLLLGDLIKKAKKKGKYEILTLSVFGNNEHAQNLYKNSGLQNLEDCKTGLKEIKSM